MPMNESRQHPNTANAQLVNKPRTRQRAHKAPPALNVPDINDDATERKRVLNVLAQRRYREFSNGSHVPLCPVIKAKSPGEKKRQSRKAASRPAGKAADDTCPANNETLTCEEAAPADTPIETLGVLTRAAFSGFADSNNGLSWNMESLDMSTSPSIMGNSELAVEGSGLDEVSCSRELDDLSVASPPSIQSQSSIGPRAPFNTLSPSELSSDGIDLSFPDSYLLPVTEFALMRAFSRIAARLGCKSNIFDLHAASPFADPSNAVSHLPQTWQPTAAQILIPHHPILDFLPWPSVRERIIYTLTLPEEMRPTVAKDPTALVDFAHDLDDSAEGIRVWGPDVYDPSSWEVGQQLFERWWFLFDRRIIEQSNTWRILRGAARLRISGAGAGTGTA